MIMRALSWFRKGNKSLRLLKVIGVALLFYWVLHFLSETLRVAEGVVAIAAYFVLILWSKQRQRYLLRTSGMSEIDGMDRESFQQRVAVHLQDIGWDSTEVFLNRTFGADFSLNDGDGNRRVVAVECSNKPLGTNVVQQISGAVLHYHAVSGLLVTNNHLTADARKLAHSNRIEVWEREQLAKSLAQSAPGAAGTNSRISTE